MESIKNESKPKINRPTLRMPNWLLGKFKLMNMLRTAFIEKNVDEKTASRRAHHHAFMSGGMPEFHTKKHTVMSYAKQNRLAKKRRKSRAA